jgi:predicted dinucleotide-binding enzyme
VRIGIIGAGNVGSALGRGWSARGHAVTFGVRQPSDARVQAAVEAAGGRARAATIREATADAEVVVLATPWPATRDAIQAAGNLSGRVLIDATNPLTDDFSALVLGHTTSGGEEVARWAPGVRVVKAFNTIGAQHMTDPRVGGERATMFLCGDDAEASRWTRVPSVRRDFSSRSRCSGSRWRTPTGRGRTSRSSSCGGRGEPRASCPPAGPRAGAPRDRRGRRQAARQSAGAAPSRVRSRPRSR